MGRHSVPPFNMGDYSLLTNLMNNSKVAKVVTYPETATPGFVGAVSAADKLRLIEDQNMDPSGSNSMNQSATAVAFIHVDLGAEYAVSHIRWALKMLIDGSGSYTGNVEVSDDNFSADVVALKTSVERAGAKVDYMWQVNKNIRYLRLYVKADMNGTRTLIWYPLAIYGNTIQL